MKPVPTLSHNELAMMRRLIREHLDGSHPNPVLYRAYLNAEKKALAHGKMFPSYYALRAAFSTLQYQRRQRRKALIATA